MSGGTTSVDRYRGPEYSRLMAAARRSLERTGGELIGRISVAQPDEAERRVIIGITGVHQPAGTKRLTVPLVELDGALRRATGLGLQAGLAALGGPLRDRPAEAASLAAHVTGDTKSLNHGTTLATLILRAHALRAGVSRPASAAERRELWDLSNVIVDDLASRVLVLGVTAEGDGLAAWLTDAARYGTPFQVT